MKTTASSLLFSAVSVRGHPYGPPHGPPIWPTPLAAIASGNQGRGGRQGGVFVLDSIGEYIFGAGNAPGAHLGRTWGNSERLAT